jgi:hypothetical protein
MTEKYKTTAFDRTTRKHFILVDKFSLAFLLHINLYSLEPRESILDYFEAVPIKKGDVP